MQCYGSTNLDFSQCSGDTLGFKREKKHRPVTANPPLPQGSALKPAAKDSLHPNGAAAQAELVSAALLMWGRLCPSTSAGPQDHWRASILPIHAQAGRASASLASTTPSHTSQGQSRQLSPIFLTELPRETFSLHAPRRKKAPGISILTGPWIRRFRAMALIIHHHMLHSPEVSQSHSRQQVMESTNPHSLPCASTN